jgi:TetR/AcrR family transcriptional repressor of nem operon
MPWEKQFDRDQALERAETVFWKRGYDNSSMEALLKGMGIQKGSFYATFRGKHEILMETLNLYVRRRFEMFKKLQQENAPLVALRRHLDNVFEESTGTRRSMGCFLVNSALELAPRDPAVRKVAANALHAHTEFLRELLDEAKRRGELSEDYDSGTRASALVGVVLGMRVMARAGMPAATIQALRQEAETLLASSGK